MSKDLCYGNCKHFKNEDSMKQTVRNYPIYKKDKDAEIDSYEQIDLTDETNRVLWNFG